MVAIDNHWFSPHHLRYLINKNQFIWWSSFPFSQWLLPIINALEADCHHYTIDQYWYYLRTTLPNGSIKTFYGYDYGLNRSDAHRVFDDKIICWKILEQAGINTPPSLLLVATYSTFSNESNNRTSAHIFAKKYGFPLIIKPINGRQWRGVAKITTLESLNHHIDILNEKGGSPYCMIQPCIPWDDIRVIYFDNTIELAYKRIPASIVWDGIRTIEQLIQDQSLQEYIPAIQDYISIYGYRLYDILKIGDSLQVLPTANISTWWTAQLVKVSKNDHIFIQHIAHTLWVRYFWADIITTGSLDEGTVIELNKMPWFTGANKVQVWFSDQLGIKIWNSLKKER